MLNHRRTFNKLVQATTPWERSRQLVLLSVQLSDIKNFFFPLFGVCGCQVSDTGKSQKFQNKVIFQKAYRFILRQTNIRGSDKIRVSFTSAI